MSIETRRGAKVYHVERRHSSLPARVKEAIDVQHHAGQGEVLVVARSVVHAHAILDDLAGMRAPRGSISVAHGNDANSLTMAGLLDEVGTVLVYRDAVRDEMVVRVTADDVTPVGAWRYVERIDPRGSYKRIEFERLDGRRFVGALA